MDRAACPYRGPVAEPQGSPGHAVAARPAAAPVPKGAAAAAATGWGAAGSAEGSRAAGAVAGLLSAWAAWGLRPQLVLARRLQAGSDERLSRGRVLGGAPSARWHSGASAATEEGGAAMVSAEGEVGDITDEVHTLVLPLDGAPHRELSGADMKACFCIPFKCMA